MIVGILGGGQLGRMLALAGYPLGLRFRFLDVSPAAPAGQLAELLTGDYEDQELLGRFADSLDVVTYEFENVPVAAVRFLAERLPVYPPPTALEAAQDRLVEKQFFQKLGIPMPAFRAVDSHEDLQSAVEQLGFPSVLKTRRMGYDGKGQLILRSDKDVEWAWELLGKGPQILEQWIPFDREVSILAVRSIQNEVAFYPLVENHHREGMLRLSLAPAPNTTVALQQQAEDYARAVLEALEYVGVLAIEFFQWEGRLLANEMAPRVHNSGHWTIEAADTSQFENHLRAILGLPLGSTAMCGHAAMVNLIGTIPSREEILSLPRSHLHLYGKAPLQNRKLGHVTLQDDDAEAVCHRLALLGRVACPRLGQHADLRHWLGNGQ